MRLDFVPCQPNSGVLSSFTVGGNTNNVIIQLNDIWSFDDPNSFDPGALTSANVLNRKDTRTHPVNRKWHLYKDARAFSASQNVPWQNTADYSPTAFNTLTKATTFLYCLGHNSGAGPVDRKITFGYLTFSWYIIFRGQRSPQVAQTN